MNSGQSPPRAIPVPVGAMTPIAPIFIPAMRAMAIAGRLARSCTAPARSACETAATRDTAAWLHFLDRLERFAPPGEVYLIVDALPLHWTLDTMLWNWGHPRFHFIPLPKRAAWLNLIEGFWKILRQRAWRTCLLHHRRRRSGAPGRRRGLESSPNALLCGTVRPNPRACSNDDMSIAFEERRT